MKTLAELRNLTENKKTENVAENILKSVSTNQIYNEFRLIKLQHSIIRLNDFIQQFEKEQPANGYFTRKELKKFLTPYDFEMASEPDFKEPFQITVKGEKITVYRYYYSKERIIRLLTLKKETYKYNMFCCGPNTLQSSMDIALRHCKEYLIKYYSLKNHRAKAELLLSEIGESIPNLD